MEKSRQLSLAQALGNLNLSGIELEKLLGRRVFFECCCNNPHGSRLKKTITKMGTIIGLHRVPGFVVIQDDRGGLYSRDLSHVWEDGVQIIELRRRGEVAAVIV